MPLDFEYIEKINKRQNRVYISHNSKVVLQKSIFIYKNFNEIISRDYNRTAKDLI